MAKEDSESYSTSAPVAADPVYYEHDCLLPIDGKLVFFIHKYLYEHADSGRISLKEMRSWLEERITLPNKDKKELIFALAKGFCTDQNT